MIHQSNISLGTKLIRMMLISLLSALLIMIIGVLFYKYHSDYANLKRQTLLLAQVIASCSTGALEFLDKETAMENLNTLKANSDIQYAALLSLDGKVFTEYKRIPVNQSLSDPLLNSFLDDSFNIHLPVKLENRMIGKIYIQVSLNSLKQQLMTHLYSLLLITVTAFITALFLFQRLQKQISQPISQLIEATVSVSKHKDYSIQLTPIGEGDLALLTHGFNEMLKQIEIREKKLAHYQHNLKTKITEQNVELSMVNQQRLLWLETMANFLQHELKNATVGVNSSLDLIERRQEKGRDINVYIQRARKSMHYMEELLSNASAASSLEAALYQEKLLPLNLSTLISERYEEYQSLYTKEHFTVYCEQGLYIKGNAERISQLLDKLVSNAVDHHQPDTEIELSLYQEKQAYICISVSNYGNTLPADSSRLFELFFSKRPAEAQINNHHGLGLYIVRLITEYHHGHAYALNRETGDGAIFKVVLPLFYNAKSRV